MQHPLIRRFDVGRWLQAVYGSPHLVGRDIGRACREAIEAQLSMSVAESVTTLDCALVDHLDLTGADECVVKLIRRIQALEYGDLYVVLDGLTPTHEENLLMALKGKGLATLVQRKDGPEILGDLDPYLRHAFDFLKAETTTTTRAMVAALGMSLSLASTKFLNLHKARLVQRESHNMPDGGRQFVYRLVQGNLEGRHEF